MKTMHQFIDKLISRLEKESYEINLDGYIASTQKRIIEMEDVNEIVNQLAEEYKGGWISCSDMLPEEGEDVLVWYEYFRYGNFNCMYQTYGIGFHYDGHWSGNVSGTNAKCIAWQPLPEPYRKEGE